jgi:hypothetical protein
MPRLIDYVGRFEFIRQAAFAVVRDEGVEALSRRRVAAELGTGVNTIRRSVAGWADLTRLAADQVRSRRMLGRLGRRSDEPLEAATSLVRSLMPEDATHLDEELVWLKLVTACALRPSGLEPPGQVRREFQIAQRGYDDGQPVDIRPALETPTEREDRRTALQPYVAERDRELSTTITFILDVLEVPEPRENVAATLVALVEGLTLSACLGRLTPEQATELAIAHVIELGSRPRTSPGAAA